MLFGWFFGDLWLDFWIFRVVLGMVKPGGCEKKAQLYQSSPILQCSHSGFQGLGDIAIHQRHQPSATPGIIDGFTGDTLPDGNIPLTDGLLLLCHLELSK